MSLDPDVPDEVRESQAAVERTMLRSVRLSVVVCTLIGGGAGVLAGGVVPAVLGLVGGAVVGLCLGYLALMAA